MVFFRPINSDDEDCETRYNSQVGENAMEVSVMSWNSNDSILSPLNQPMNHTRDFLEKQNNRNFFTGKYAPKHDIGHMSPFKTHGQQNPAGQYTNFFLCSETYDENTKTYSKKTWGYSQSPSTRHFVGPSLPNTDSLYSLRTTNKAYERKPRVQLLSDSCLSTVSPMEVDFEDHSNQTLVASNRPQAAQYNALAEKEHAAQESGSKVSEAVGGGDVNRCRESVDDRQTRQPTFTKRNPRFSKSWMACAVLMPIFLIIAFMVTPSEYLAYLESYYEQSTDGSCLDLDLLEKNFKSNVFGQHIAVNSIPLELRNFLDPANHHRTLVLSVHGSSGTGKLHISRQITSLLPKEDYQFFYVYKEPTIERNVNNFKNDIQNLLETTSGKGSECPYVVVMYTMEYAPQLLVDELVRMIDSLVRKTSGKFVFLILSNTGSDVINDVVKESLARGLPRESISEDAFLKNRHFLERLRTSWPGKLIEGGVVDRIIPVLPLEGKHLEMCAKEFARRCNVSVDDKLIREVVNDILHNPPHLSSFSATGCKKVSSRMEAVIYGNTCKDNPDVVSLVHDDREKVCLKT